MPNDPETGTHYPAHLIDDLCDGFEAGWRTGSPLLLEGVVASAPESLRPELFRELLAVEGAYRAKALRPITPSEARDRFAGLGPWAETVIRELFAKTSSWADPTRQVASTADRASRSRVGKYELIASLGSGAHGIVFKARHPELDRFCAVKVLFPPRAQTPDALGRFRLMAARFRRERVALARLGHPNIIQATDGGESGGALYLVMEFVDGADLGRVVKAVSRLTVPDACEVVRQAAEGLSYIHQNRMIHRDVKPSNLLLGRDGVVRVLDLGLARLAEFTPGEWATETGALMGTPDFIAPEQARGSQDVDIRADVYSLGCTLYAFLTGTPPFAAPEYDNPYKKFKAHNEAPVPSLAPARPDIPPGLEELLLKMLRKDPADRPDSPAAVAREIAPFCAGHDLPQLVPPAPPDPLDPPTLPEIEPLLSLAALLAPVPNATTLTNTIPRSRRLTGILLTVAIVLVAGTAIWFATRPSSGPYPLVDGMSSSDEKGPPPHVFQSGEWTELLDREPTILGWPDVPGRDWRFDRVKRELWISHRDLAMFQLAELGELEAGFDLEATVAQTPWVGGFGLFVRGRAGRHGGEEIVSADYLMLDMQPDLRTELASMTRGLVQAVLRVRLATTDQLNSQAGLSRPHDEHHRFTISVMPGRLARIRMDGNPYAEKLVIPAHQYPERPGCFGSVGVLVHSTSTTFRSVRVRPHKLGEVP